MPGKLEHWSANAAILKSTAENVNAIVDAVNALAPSRGPGTVVRNSAAGSARHVPAGPTDAGTGVAYISAVASSPAALQVNSVTIGAIYDAFLYVSNGPATGIAFCPPQLNTPDCLVVNLAEFGAGANVGTLQKGQSVVGRFVGCATNSLGNTVPVIWCNAAAPTFFPVLVSLAGGSNGSATTMASYFYKCTSLDGATVYSTGIGPTRPRRNGSVVAGGGGAGVGIGYFNYHGSPFGFCLYDAGEVASTSICWGVRVANGDVILLGSGGAYMDASGNDVLYDNGGCCCCGSPVGFATALYTLMTVRGPAHGTAGYAPLYIYHEAVTEIGGANPGSTLQYTQVAASAAGAHTFTTPGGISHPSIIVLINHAPRAADDATMCLAPGSTKTYTLAAGDYIAAYVVATTSNLSYAKLVPEEQDGASGIQSSCTPLVASSLPWFGAGCPSTLTVTLGGGSQWHPALTNANSGAGGLAGGDPLYYAYDALMGQSAVYIAFDSTGAATWEVRIATPSSGPTYSASAPYAGLGDTPTGKTWTVPAGQAAITVTTP